MSPPPQLLALSKYFKVPIYVIQGGSQAVKIGIEEPWAKKATPLTISYHRHSWGLGEHVGSGMQLQWTAPSAGIPS